MEYIFMSKNTPLLSCEIDNHTGFILRVNEIYNKDFLPVSMANIPDDKNRLQKYLYRWWSKRAIPASRQGIKEALQKTGLGDTKDLLIKSLGLNLSDQYWMNPEGKLEWSAINFFQNPFSEDVGNVLFQEPIDRESLDLMSPDNASDGWLKKRWKIINNKRVLIKGSSGPFHQEPLNEEIASVLMRRMGINHVSYSVEWRDDLPYSLCETFVDIDTELVPASHVIDSIEYKSDTSLFEHFKKACDKLEIEDAVASVNEMLLLDFIIENTDRHLNNFGFIRNVETLEWKGFAPIYDSGTSLWNKERVPGIKTENNPATFAPSNTEQLQLITDFSWFSLEELSVNRSELLDILQQSPHIDDFRKEQIVGAIGSNVRHIEKFIKDQQTSITKNKLYEELLSETKPKC